MNLDDGLYYITIIYYTHGLMQVCFNSYGNLFLVNSFHVYEVVSLFAVNMIINIEMDCFAMQPKS